MKEMDVKIHTKDQINFISLVKMNIVPTIDCVDNLMSSLLSGFAEVSLPMLIVLLS